MLVLVGKIVSCIIQPFGQGVCMADGKALVHRQKNVVGSRGMAWCLIALFALLTGCVEQPTRARLKPKSDDGAVLLRVAENLPGTFVYGDNVTVRRIPDAVDTSATCYVLHIGLKGLSTSTFLAGALPAGTYDFPTIGADKQSIGACNHRDLLKTHASAFGKFKVVPGRLTYLGVIERTGGNKQHRNLMIPVLDTATENLGEILREVFPELAHFDTRTPLGWITSSLPPGLSQADAYALAYAYGLFSPAQTTDGSWIFGSRIGVIRSWRPGQAGTLLHDTGRRVALGTLAVLPDGTWLAGGEESTLLASNDDGRTWQSRRGDLPYGLIVDIAPVDKDVLLTLVAGKEVLIYRGQISARHWHEVASYQTEFSIWTGFAGVAPQSWLVGDTYVTTLPSRHLGLYRLANGTSETLDLPGSVQVFSVSNDHVLRCRCTATLAVNPYESDDLGKTWKSSTFSRYAALPGMADSTHGVTLYKDGLFKPSFMSYTSDSGRTWQMGTGGSADLRHFFYSRDLKTVYASNDSDAVWISHDGGRHWHYALAIVLPAGDYPLIR